MSSKDRPAASVTKRVLLKGAVASIGALPLLAAVDAQAAAKMPQSAVAYRDTPNGDKKCSNCALFMPPNACRTVGGTISPNGWCKIWVKKG